MGNLDKTIRYMKRNGIVNTCYAIQERLLSKKGVPYSYVEISEDELAKQKAWSASLKDPILFSILVPVYETKEEYLRAMIESCLNQSYEHYELIIADASVSDGPGKVVRTYADKRIKYVHLNENRGISGNTNACLQLADGEYCALLDHDDLLTLDALYENAKCILDARAVGKDVDMIYSDEDKCDSLGKIFSDPHYKKDLNLDLLLSNNYICHLTVMKTDLIKELEFRTAYDGSQDYDLFLRAVGKIVFEDKEFKLENLEKVAHIPMILYHWRCHEASTAINPASKEYAYSAGKKAIKDFVKEYYGSFQISELLHKGFYSVEWKDILKNRPEVGAVVGLVSSKGKMVAGFFDEHGEFEYEGLNVHFSGYRNRASLKQQVYAPDIRYLVPAPEYKGKYEELYSKLSLNDNMENVKKLSFEFADFLKKEGRICVLDPKFNAKKI